MKLIYKKIIRFIFAYFFSIVIIFAFSYLLHHNYSLAENLGDVLFLVTAIFIMYGCNIFTKNIEKNIFKVISYSFIVSSIFFFVASLIFTNGMENILIKLIFSILLGAFIGVMSGFLKHHSIKKLEKTKVSNEVA
ncbi:hypothetical protein J7L68_07280 [bacterium]|nr:hypothetical protein [bacterium]